MVSSWVDFGVWCCVRFVDCVGWNVYDRFWWCGWEMVVNMGLEY